MSATTTAQDGSTGHLPRERRTISVCPLASGSTLSLPLLILNGRRPGPRVGICGGIHGDEIIAVQVIRELWESLDPDTVTGSIWFMPVANPLAFEALTRNTPIDMLDLNRNFPGAADGWLSEQLAAAITENYLRHMNWWIDIHAGGTFPFVDYCMVLNDEGLSRAFLSDLLYRPGETRHHPGSASEVAERLGIRTAVLELGGGYEKETEHVARNVGGVINMLRYIGTLSGEVEKAGRQILLNDIKTMKPRAGGLCYPTPPLPPGTVIEGHVKIAEIVSPYTFETLETVVTPFEKNVIVLSRNYVTRINPGDYMFMIGDLSTATS
jgi:predicted deacylase